MVVVEVVVVVVVVVVEDDVVDVVEVDMWVVVCLSVEDSSSTSTKFPSTISCPTDPTFCSLVSPEEEDLLKVYSPGGCCKRNASCRFAEEVIDGTNQSALSAVVSSVALGEEAISGGLLVVVTSVVVCPPLSSGELVVSLFSGTPSGCTICRYGSSLLIRGTTFPPRSHGGGSRTLSVTVPPTVSTANCK